MRSALKTGFATYVGAGLALCLMSVAAVGAEGAGTPADVTGIRALSANADAKPEPQYSNEIEKYCANIADAARDQRYLRQKQELEALQARIDERVKLLEQRSEEYREWLGKREAFMRVADGVLVDIYKNMKPDSAADQLSLVSPTVAAAIVMKLNARLSSQILNEMDAEKAAALAGIIADAAATRDEKNPS